MFTFLHHVGLFTHLCRSYFDSCFRICMDVTLGSETRVLTC